jgi:hypothetical protein
MSMWSRNGSAFVVPTGHSVGTRLDRSHVGTSSTSDWIGGTGNDVAVSGGAPGREERAALVTGHRSVVRRGADSQPHLAAVGSVLGGGIAQAEHLGGGGERFADLDRPQNPHRPVVQVRNGAAGGVGGLADRVLHHQRRIGERTGRTGRDCVSRAVAGQLMLVPGDGAVQHVVGFRHRDSGQRRNRATGQVVVVIRPISMQIEHDPMVPRSPRST